MRLIRVPFSPIHDPTASILSLSEYTAIFVLFPASRATLYIKINPSFISGISSSNNVLQNHNDFLIIE